MRGLIWQVGMAEEFVKQSEFGQIKCYVFIYTNYCVYKNK